MIDLPSILNTLIVSESNLAKFVKLYNQRERVTEAFKRAMKNELILVQGKLFTSPQVNGSCAFYSLYWAYIFVACIKYPAEMVIDMLADYIKFKGEQLKENIDNYDTDKIYDGDYVAQFLGLCDLVHSHGMCSKSGKEIQNEIFTLPMTAVQEYKPAKKMTVDILKIKNFLNLIRKNQVTEDDIYIIKDKLISIVLPPFFWVELCVLHHYYLGSIAHTDVGHIKGQNITGLLQLSVSEAYIINKFYDKTEKMIYRNNYISQEIIFSDIEVVPRCDINNYLYTLDNIDTMDTNYDIIDIIGKNTIYDRPYRNKIALKHIWNALEKKDARLVAALLPLYYNDTYFEEPKYYITLAEGEYELHEILLPKVSEWMRNIDGLFSKDLSSRLNRDKHMFLVDYIPEVFDLKEYVPAYGSFLTRYILFRLGFVDYRLYMNGNNLFAFEETNAGLRYAEIKENVITLGGDLVYFGLDNNEWIYFNLPLYGPCVVVMRYDKGRPTYVIVGRKDIYNPIFKSLFTDVEGDQIKVYFEMPIGRSELFPVLNENYGHLLMLQYHYGARPQVRYNPGSFTSSGIVPTVVPKIPRIFIGDYLSKETRISEQYKFEHPMLIEIKEELIKSSARSPAVFLDETPFPKDVEDKFTQTHFVCDFSCIDTSNLIGKINRCIQFFERTKIEIIQKVDINVLFPLGLLSLFIENADICLNVITCNTILEFLYNVRYAIETCEGKICNDIAEYIEMITYPLQVSRPVMRNYELYFIGVFGSFVRADQFDKVDQINYDLDNGIKRVHQFMMGKGKSSVITPLVMFDRIFRCSEYPYIVVPQHLYEQTVDTLKPFQIVDVNCVKTAKDFSNMFLEGKINGQTILLDEFDMLADPSSCVLNIVLQEESWFDDDKLEKVFFLVDGSPVMVSEAYLEETVRSLNLKLIENINYGMGKTYKRTVVPYLRKDTPMETSRFSSVIHTIVYTILYYKSRNYVLRIEDYKKIFEEHGKKVADSYTQLMEKHIYCDVAKRKDFFIWYLKSIKDEFRISREVKNMSFLDIMTMDTKQVGYSGTVSIFLPEKDENDYEDKIVEDPDEAINVYAAITGMCNVSQNVWYNFVDLFDIPLDRYDCLIDLIAYFKEDNEKVVERLSKVVKRNIVYLDQDDIKKVYLFSSDKSVSYFPGINSTRPFFYYSQKNSVGIDFKQPSNMTGLILFDINTKYTDAAQGIYRLRKLNKGHKIDIAFYGGKMYNKIQIYNLLIENETKAKQAKYPYFLLQRFKNVVRRHTTTDYPYVEQTRFSFQGDEWSLEELFKLISPRKIENIPIVIKATKDLLQLEYGTWYDIILGSSVTQLETVKVTSTKVETEYDGGYGEVVVKNENKLVPKFIVEVNFKDAITQFMMIAIHLFGSLYCSLNIFNPVFWTLKSLAYVKISGFFLLEPLASVIFYWDRYPVFNTHGMLMNKRIFPEENILIDLPHKLCEIFKNVYKEEIYEGWKNLKGDRYKTILLFMAKWYPNFRYIDLLDDFIVPLVEDTNYYPDPISYGLDRMLMGVNKVEGVHSFTLDPYNVLTFTVNRISIEEKFRV